MRKKNKAEQSADQVDKVREKLNLKAALIVREQEQVVEACNKGIDKINSDLKALRNRLEPKLEGPYDETFYSLKERYGNKLAERESLQRARVIAEDSISASKLHVIPGEFDRSDY